MRYLLIVLLVTTTLSAADPLVERACAGDEDAVRSLRLAGPTGLQSVCVAFDASTSPKAATWDRVFDAVAAQRHARYSRLYWFTDLELAKAESAATGKPIVSLRLLGKLTDELSCANSRFFRALLYPDPTVSVWLREHAILHWSSERPVPRVTIDFGDGRTMETTITGNSAHYILDAEGRPLDVIPGLMAPQPFLESLRAAADLHRQLAAHPTNREDLVQTWHSQRYAAINAARAACGIVVPERIVNHDRRPAAADALPIAMGKSIVEMPVLDAIQLTKALHDEGIITAPTTATWFDVGSTWQNACQLPESTIALLQSLYAFTLFGTPVEPNPLNQLLTTLAADTARNSWDLHRTIHQWFIADGCSDFSALNKRIYGELFITPTNDPWLGLRSTAFDGIVH